jgi:hypothetical protein
MACHWIRKRKSPAAWIRRKPGNTPNKKPVKVQFERSFYIMAQIKEKVNAEFTISKNEQFGSYEIKFDGIPAKETRDALKALRFRWHSVKKVWYGFADEETIIKTVAAQPAPIKLPEAEEVDRGTLYSGWRGGNNRKWRDETELKQFLKDDFKRAGVKVTIRSGRGGYLTSLYFTISIRPEEIKSFEEWKAENELNIWDGSFPWISYTDENGRIKDMLKDEAIKRTDEPGGEALRENILKTKYQILVKNLSNSGSIPSAEVLTSEAAAKLDAVKAIVSSYNKDCSNSMVDYFDRDIYDWYTFKIA